MIETNLDDITSEQLVYAEEKLFSAGALDVFKTPIIMKKGRPAIKLSVLSKADTLELLQEIIVKETTAIGMRFYPVEKLKLQRSYEKVETPYGCITIKSSFYKGECVNQKAEFEEVKALAIQKGVPIKKVYEAVNNRMNRRTDDH